MFLCSTLNSVLQTICTKLYLQLLKCLKDASLDQVLRTLKKTKNLKECKENSQRCSYRLYFWWYFWRIFLWGRSFSMYSFISKLNLEKSPCPNQSVPAYSCLKSRRQITSIKFKWKIYWCTLCNWHWIFSIKILIKH